LRSLIASMATLALNSGLCVWRLLMGRSPGPTESQAQGRWRLHVGAVFVGAARVPWPSLLPVLT
jgi:hypothetical protein